LIPAAWYVVRRWRLAGAAGIALVAIAVTYPVIPLGHLTQASSEVSDRSAAFVFGGVAYVVAIWWYRLLSTQGDLQAALTGRNHWWHRLLRTKRSVRVTSPSRGRRTLALGLVLVLGLTFCFVGGGIIGAADWSYVPGRYMVSADNRSIDQLALAAGSWEAENIRSNSRVVGDRDNSLVAQSYGGLHVVTPAADRVDEGAISNLLLRRLAPSDVVTVCTDHVQYLIADARLATALPEVGIYVDQGEYLFDTRTGPPSVGDLTKFDQVRGAERVYDNGAIRIFDLKGLSCRG
jgi:hypothetical protein